MYTEDFPSATTARQSLRSLVEVLDYANPYVVYKFTEMFDVSLADAEEIFVETKRMLWLMASLRADPDRSRKPFTLQNEIIVLDEMWHTFILFTHPYMQFCDDYLGGYLHHSPTTRDEKLAAVAWTPEERIEAAQRSLRETVAQVVEVLGGEVANKWFIDLARRYDLPVLQARFHRFDLRAQGQRLRAMLSPERSGEIRVTASSPVASICESDIQIDGAA